MLGLDIVSLKCAVTLLKNVECSRLLSTDTSTVLRDIAYIFIMFDVHGITDKLDMTRDWWNDDHIVVHGSFDSSMLDTNDDANNKLLHNRFYDSDWFLSKNNAMLAKTRY